MKKKIVVVDSHCEDSEQIVKCIEEVYSRVDIVVMNNILDAYRYIWKEDVSLVITSIEMGTRLVPEQSGVRLVQHIRKYARYQFLPIIVVTRLEEFRSYMYQQMNCFGFFLKPLDEEAFKNSVMRALRYVGEYEEEKVFAVRRHNVYHMIKVEDVIYVESRERTLQIHFTDGSILEVSQKPIQYIMQAARSRDFIRCARGTLINRKHMIGYSTDIQSVLMLNGTLVKVGKVYSNKMKEISKEVHEYQKNIKKKQNKNKYRTSVKKYYR